jgi:hypothetical protein
MLKRLAILGLFGALTAVGLLAGQTAPLGTPKQGITKSNSGQDGKAQTDPQGGNQTPPNAVPGPTNPPAPTCDETCQQGRRNLEIQGKLEWFTGVLAIVGVLQVGTMVWQAWLLRGTLGEIHTQAGHMERQTKILEDSVAAAQKSADAALAQVEAAKSVQRAQLRVEFVEPGWTVDYEAGGYPVKFRIILDGTTRAYILDDSIIAYIGVKPRDRGAWMGMGLPRNFTPEMSPFYGDTILRTVEALPQPETDASKVQLAEESKLTVFLNGQVRYRDIFGDEWILEIDRYWKSWVSFGDEDTFGGNWYPVGSGRHDTHRKAGTYREREPENPN